MGNSNSNVKLNTIAICSVSFMSVAVVAWIVYIGLMLAPLSTSVEGGNNYVENGKWAALGIGILFTFGSWLSSLFNRTNWVPGTVGNWTNTIFWSAITLTGLGFFAMLFLFNETMRNEPRYRITLILIFVIASWLLLIPDLMPQDCLPKN